MSVKRARINSVRPVLPTPAPVRVVADQIRITATLGCYAAWELVEFHHAGHLDSFDADEEVASRKQCRAWKLIRAAADAVSEKYVEMFSTPGYRDRPGFAPYRMSIQAAVINEIRGFAPDPIAGLVDYSAIVERVRWGYLDSCGYI